MSVLLGINSGKVCGIICQYVSENSVFLTYALEKCVLFASNSLKMSVLFDVSSGKFCSIIWN